jgi:hypothetical protein
MISNFDALAVFMIFVTSLVFVTSLASVISLALVVLVDLVALDAVLDILSTSVFNALVSNAAFFE